MHKKIIVCEYCGRILIDPALAGIEEKPKEAPAKPKRTRKAPAVKDPAKEIQSDEAPAEE